MLAQMKAELEQYGALKPGVPQIVQLVSDSMSSTTIPDRMKNIIAVSEVVTFASQFRRNIWHWEGFELPINATAFLVAGSGIGKDSGVSAARRCFAEGYAILDNKRKQLAKEQAIKSASDAGEDVPYEWENYKKYYSEPVPVFIAPNTVQGLIQHLNDMASINLGAGLLYAGELSDELATNVNILEVIKTIAETYDLGNKEVNFTKGKEHRSKAITAMALNSLFVGSQLGLLYDPQTRKKFLHAFGSKLARRSLFCYVPQPVPEKVYSNTKEMLADKKENRDKCLTIREKVSKGVTKLTEYQLSKNNELLQISEDVFELFEIYLRYNYEKAKHIHHKFPLSKLVREHLQWKSLKLAGAFAIFNLHDKVEASDYIDAINFCEMLDEDMTMFETELIKESYEQFSDYMHSIAAEGKASISVHDLKKLGYITGTGSPVAKMKELIFLASSYDKKAIYTYSDQEIKYEAIQPTNALTLSYLPIDNTPIFKAIESGDAEAITRAKNLVASKANTSMEVAEVTFPDIAKMLTKDFAYSPFTYKDNKRTKDTIITGTKFVVFDVDHSKITASEAHYILQDINHHIALSSNKDNEFKFRLLIELDSVVDVNSQVWKHFFLSIANSLALTVDPLPQSQLFFSYSGREVLSLIDKSPLEVRDHLMLAHDKVNSKSAVAEKPLTTPQKQALLNDELTTFSFAFECVNNGSLNLVKAARYAKDLGMTNEEIVALMHRINNYWQYPITDEALFKRTITDPIMRW